MLDIIDSRKPHAIISTAATSTLSQMLYKKCKERGVEVINLVKDKDHAKSLQAGLGAKYVLDQSDNKFLEHMAIALKETNASLMFECLGGDLPGKIFRLMPPGSEMVVYGNLTEQRLGIDNWDIHYSKKRVDSLFVGDSF